jgi:RHS repeat-associated protein
MMRRQRSIVVFLIMMLTAAINAVSQSIYEPPPAPPRKTPTPIPAVLSGVQRPQALGFGDTGESGTYSYDGSGNITAIGTDTFVYDAEGRLVTAVVRGVTGSYTYDAFGNRKTATGETNCYGQTVCATPLTVEPSTNRLMTTTNSSGTTANVAYDAAGNITAATGGSYTYDGTGMMIEATVGSDDRQFVYTADDERIAVRQGVSWTWTVRGLDNKVLREFTSAEPNNDSAGFPTAGGQWIKDYVWRDGLLLASVAKTNSGTVTYHYHLDHLGTPRLITDTSGVKVAEHVYYPFGAEINLTPHESTEEAMKFTGHERDIVAGDGHTLDDMHARYYNGSLGRFLEVDPIPGDTHIPQSWNVYAYVRNATLQGTDPTGLTLRVMTAAAGRELCKMVGSQCADHVQIGKDGTVTVKATADELKANEALNLVNDMVQSQNKYGAWVGNSMPSGNASLPLGPQERDNTVINLSTTARTDIPSRMNLPLPPGFDGAVGIYSGFSSIATGKGGLPVSMSMLLFHELAENYYRTDKAKQYVESHQNAITRENLLRVQRPELNQYSHGSGVYIVTPQP